MRGSVNLDGQGVRVELSERNFRDFLAMHELQGEASLGRLTSSGYVLLSVRSDDVYSLGPKPGIGGGLGT